MPWTSEFRFDLEVWHWVACKISQSAVVYWYGVPGARSNASPCTREMLAIPVVPPLVLRKVPHAIEGESLKVVAVGGGKLLVQDLTAFGVDRWSEGRQLWWVHPAPGDRVTLDFPAPSAGRYRVKAGFTAARDYGIHRLSINGVDAGGDRDFFGKSVAPTADTDLGIFVLKPDSNLLTVTCVGRNAESQAGFMFGLDWLVLEPAP